MSAPATYGPDQLFEISLKDLHALTTHAAVASSAAADDNGRREREAWALFDNIITRVTCCPVSDGSD